METKVYSLEEVFFAKIFSIPDCQRGYSWEKQQCEELLEDLDLLPHGFTHYTGTLVLHSNKSTFQDVEGSSYSGYDIVDGQQRLTSLIILLKTIKHSPFFITQGIIPSMRSKNWGRIVFFSSIVAQTGIPGTAAYSASKRNQLGKFTNLAV